MDLNRISVMVLWAGWSLNDKHDIGQKRELYLFKWWARRVTIDNISPMALHRPNAQMHPYFHCESSPTTTKAINVQDENAFVFIIRNVLRKQTRIRHDKKKIKLKQTPPPLIATFDTKHCAVYHPCQWHPTKPAKLIKCTFLCNRNGFR